MQYSQKLDEYLKIEGEYYPFITSYKVGMEPLMSSDTGRSVQTGSMQGRLIGIFPKIELTISPSAMTTAEATVLYNHLIVNKNITVEYFDPSSNAVRTGSFYAGTLALPVEQWGEAGDFSINLISNNRL